MLLRFRFSNFRSFKDEQELSLVAGPFSDLPEIVRHPPAVQQGVLPIAAIYGANASGKSNVLSALRFTSSAVTFSHGSWKPDQPIQRDAFLTNKEIPTLPSEFVADILLGDIRHQYGFRVDSEAFLEEWLFVYPKGKKQKWFHRKQGRPTSFSSKMPGENRTIENLTRANSLFLAAAAQNNHEALLPVFQWFANSVSFVQGFRSGLLQHTIELCQAADFKTRVARLISAADLGIADIEIQQTKTSEEMKKVFEAIISTVKPPSADEITLPEMWPEVRFLHRLGDKTVPLNPDQESAGTIAYLALLGPVVNALQKGTVLCVDELDASLHPLLASQLMQLFSGTPSNPVGAQLIFNTHDTNLLSSGGLRRDQIWFTEKNDDATSHLYPLSDFKPRKQENLENGYLQGRYGAIPFINPDALLIPFEARDGKA